MSKLNKNWLDYTNNDHPEFKNITQKYEAEALLMQGWSCREVARRVDCHRDTICRFRAHLVRFNDEEIYCPCGKPSNHRGWCKIRVQANPKRLEYLKNFWDEVRAGKRKSPTETAEYFSEKTRQIFKELKNVL